MNSRKSSTGGQARAKTEGTPEGVRDGPSDSPSASDNLLRSQSRQIHRKPLSASSPIRCESIDRKNYRSPEKTKKGSSGTNSSRAGIPNKNTPSGYTRCTELYPLQIRLNLVTSHRAFRQTDQLIMIQCIMKLKAIFPVASQTIPNTYYPNQRRIQK